MVEYTKKPAGDHGWFVQADFKKGGGINAEGPLYRATEAEADEWIAEHKRRHGMVQDKK